MNLGFLFILLFLPLFTNSEDYTCSDSATLQIVSTQCTSVKWSVARLIDHNNTIESDYYPVVLDFSEQEDRVSVCVFT